MSFLDRIAAALAPTASEADRSEARDRLTQHAVDVQFVQDIVSQHRKIEALFARARQESGPQAVTTVRELAVLLNGHAMAEEAVIYPEISENSKADAGMAYEEHAMTKVQMAALQKLSAGTQEWHEKLDHIESAVQQHVYQEESSWLPDIIGFLPVEDQQRMSTEFRTYLARFDAALDEA